MNEQPLSDGFSLNSVPSEIAFGGPESASSEASSDVSAFLSNAAANDLQASGDRFIPKQPASLQAAHLNENAVGALIIKFLYVRGINHGRAIADQIKLPFGVVEKILFALKNQLMVSYHGVGMGGDYRYELTPKGVEQARNYMSHCTYFGAAPVSIPEYFESVKRQSVQNLQPTLKDITHALRDLVLGKEVIAQIGQATRAGKSMFLFGNPGNGKSSIAQRLIYSINETIWIPRTLAVGGEIIRLYDPSLHEERPLPNSGGIFNDQEIDERWVRIQRPVIKVGGELSLSNLEINLNPVTGILEAPIHLKSNCGCLIVDDFGRQRVSTVDLLNRWIVPLECGKDHVNMPSGRQLLLPFDQLIVFSTNLRPSELCDEAFLRRIPYKIRVDDPTEAQFRELWNKRAEALDIISDAQWLDYLINNHYLEVDRAMRFCHVDDLLGQVREYAEFHGVAAEVTGESLEMAVKNYFSAL